MASGPTKSTVLITGASSGIGAATAIRLAEAGHPVMLAARREDRLAELAGRLNRQGFTAAWLQADVTSRADMERLAEATAKQFGRIDVLVNNAGIMPLSLLAKGRVDEWDRMIDVNIKGVLYGMAAVLPGMLKQGGGHVVSLSSVAGLAVTPGSAVYSGTKFAVRAIMEGLRKELGANAGIRTTTICPGMTVTELPQSIGDLEFLELLRSRYSFEGPLAAVDVANAILYAVSQPPHVDVNEIVLRPVNQGG